MPDVGEEIRQFIESGIDPIRFDDLTAQSTHRSDHISVFHRRAAFVLGGMAASIAVVILVSAVLLRPSAPHEQLHLGARSQSSRAVQVTLDEVASNAKTLPSVALSPGQKMSITDDFALAGYVAGASGQIARFSVPGSANWLIGQDGTGIQTVSLGVPVFASADDKEAWASLGSPQLVPTQTFVERLPLSPAESQSKAAQNGVGALPVTPTVIPYDTVKTLSTNPSVLRGQIEDLLEGGVPNAGKTFDLVASLLEEGAGPAQRSALYQVIAGLPGVSLLGPTTADVTGAMGTAVSIDVSGQRHVIVFDPTSSAVMEERIIPDTEWPGSLPLSGNGEIMSNERLSYTIFRSVLPSD
jgi:hypothetical protein